MEKNYPLDIRTYQKLTGLLTRAMPKLKLMSLHDD